MSFDVLDEHEQGEVVRKWLRENAMSMVIGVGVGLLLIFGWQQWKLRGLRGQAEAAMQYQAFVDAADAKRADDASKLAETLRKDHAKSPYPVFAALRQAETAVTAGNLDDALGDLEWASKNTKTPALKALADLRMAQVRLAQGNADAALGLLNAISKDVYTDLVNELRGDALAALGRNDEARNAYEQAMASMDERSPSRTLVQMKLVNLSTTSQKQNS